MGARAQTGKGAGPANCPSLAAVATYLTLFWKNQTDFVHIYSREG